MNSMFPSVDGILSICLLISVFQSSTSGTQSYSGLAANLHSLRSDLMYTVGDFSFNSLWASC